MTHWRLTMSTLLWGIVSDALWAARGSRGAERGWTAETALREAERRLRALGLRPSGEGESG